MLHASQRAIVESLLDPFPGEEESPAATRGATQLARCYSALQLAGIPRRRAAAWGAASLAVGLAVAGAGAPIAGLLTLLGFLGAGLLAVGRRLKKRASELERDLPALLTTIASSVRAGADPLSGMIQAQRFFPAESLVARELHEFSQRLKAGESEETAMRLFMADLGSADLELFKRCMWLSRQHGASLAEPLHRVVKVVRQRQSFRRKTRGALAMHRMSAVGIAACAAIIAAIQFCMNGAGVQLAWEHPVGWKLLSAGGGLMATGIVWMMSLGREEKL